LRDLEKEDKEQKNLLALLSAFSATLTQQLDPGVALPLKWQEWLTARQVGLGAQTKHMDTTTLPSPALWHRNKFFALRNFASTPYSLPCPAIQ